MWVSDNIILYVYIPIIFILYYIDIKMYEECYMCLIFKSYRYKNKCMCEIQYT